jgi:hypothetical protein
MHMNWCFLRKYLSTNLIKVVLELTCLYPDNNSTRLQLEMNVYNAYELLYNN